MKGFRAIVAVLGFFTAFGAFEPMARAADWTSVFGALEQKCPELPVARDIALASWSAVDSSYPAVPDWKKEANSPHLIADVAKAMVYGADAAVVAIVNMASNKSPIKTEKCITSIENYFAAGNAKHSYEIPNAVKNFIAEADFATCSKTSSTCLEMPVADEMNVPTETLCSSGSYKRSVQAVSMPTNALSVFQTLGKANANRTSDYSNYVYTYEGK